MRLSAKSDYAVRALVEVAAQEPGRLVSADEIAEAQAIPRSFLLGILADLRRAGLVDSHRGQAGGWRLARPAAEISLARVIRAIDGPLASVAGVRPENVSCAGTATSLQVVWVAARDSLREVLESVTVAQVVAHELPSAVISRAAGDDAWTPR